MNILSWGQASQLASMIVCLVDDQPSLRRHKPVPGDIITPEKVNASALAGVQLLGKPGKGPSGEGCRPCHPSWDAIKIETCDSFRINIRDCAAVGRCFLQGLVCLANLGKTCYINWMSQLR